jgi:transposase
MGRRILGREVKLEAVKLVRERGVWVAKACRDLELAESVLRWLRETLAESQQAFPGHGQMRPGQQEIERLRREVAKLKAGRDMLKKGRGVLRNEVRAFSHWSE